jgi:hypothetical protein
LNKGVTRELRGSGKEPALVLRAQNEKKEREPGEPQKLVFNDPLTKWADLEGAFKLIRKGIRPYIQKNKKLELERKDVETIKQRADLLARDDDLRLVYDRLVLKSASITEKEFWESHAGVIEREKITQSQRLGMSTAMLTDIRSSTSRSECNIYRITPQVCCLVHGAKIQLSSRMD